MRWINCDGPWKLFYHCLIQTVDLPPHSFSTPVGQLPDPDRHRHSASRSTLADFRNLKPARRP